MDVYVEGLTRSLFPEHGWGQSPESYLVAFAESPDAQAIYILVGENSLTLAMEIPANVDSLSIVAVTKGAGSIDPEEPLSSQLGWVVLPGSSGMVQALWASVNFAVAPFLSSMYANAKDRLNIAGANQKASELAIALENLQHHQEIPFLTLEVDSEAITNRDLDSLQKSVAQWKRQIRSLTQISRDVDTGSVNEEISFWVNMDESLNQVQKQLDGPNIKAVLHMLEEGKRFHATVNFARDTGLPGAIEKVNGYCLLLRDLPISDLLSVSALDKIVPAMHNIFLAIGKKLRQSQYPVQRSVQLVDALGRDVEQQIRKFLIKEALLDEDLRRFESISSAVDLIVAEWEASVRDYSSTARDVMRRRAERYAPVRVNVPGLMSLDQRIERVRKLRKRHAELMAMVKGNLSAYEAITSAYHDFASSVDPLGEEGQWVSEKRKYSEAILTVENSLAQHIQAQLANAPDAASMFTIFSSVGGLVSRPVIRVALREYQSILVDRVRQDVAYLTSTIKNRPVNALDLPSAANEVVWMQQHLHRLELIFRRLNAVLGEDWQQHADAQSLAEDSSQLREQLDIEKFVRSWSKRAETEAAGAWDPGDTILRLVRVAKTDGEDESILAPSCDFTKLSIYSNVQALAALGYRSPPSLSTSAVVACNISTKAHRLRESLNSITIIRRILIQHERIRAATRRAENTVYLLIEQGLNGTVLWSSSSAHPFAAALERASFLLERQTKKAAALDDDIEAHLSRLAEAGTLSLEIDAINKLLSAQPQSLYVSAVRRDLNQVLIDRFIKDLASWQPSLRQHKVTITPSGLALSPPLTESLKAWFKELASLVLEFRAAGIAEIEFKSTAILQALSGTASRLVELSKQARFIGDNLIRFQVLWDVNTDDVPSMVGDSFEDWVGFVESFLACTQLSLTQTTGLMRIDASSAEAAINAKCDAVLKTLLPELALLATRESKRLHDEIRDTRAIVEVTPVDADNLQPLVRARELVDTTNVHDIERAHQMIPRSFISASYIYPEQVTAEWFALKQILDLRASEMENARPVVIAKLREREAVLTEKATEFTERWEASKPIQGSLDPKRALAICVRFSEELDGLIRTYKTLKSTADFVGIEAKGLSFAEIRQGVVEVAEVWKKLEGLREALDLLDSTPWHSVSTSEIGQRIAVVELGIQDCPPRLRHYGAFIKLDEDLASRKQRLPLVSMLRLPAIKTRHLIQVLNIIPRVLRDVWTRSIRVNLVEETVNAAEAEKRLEDFLMEIGDQWSSFLVDVKDNIIRNLTAVVHLADDHLAGLAAIHSSQHFAVVEAATTEWERRLMHARALLLSLAECQTQWLRLKGIFKGGNPVLNRVLPAEAQRFLTISKEVTGLIDVLSGRPALEAAASLDATLDSGLGRLRAQLSSLQRSLSSFLQSQRAQCSRLFFMGDDDILDMISSGDIGPYLTKLFVGVNTLVRESSTDPRIKGVMSLEGEVLSLSNPLEASDDPVQQIKLLESAVKIAFHREVSRALNTFPQPGNFINWFKENLSEPILVTLRINAGKCPSALDELKNYRPVSNLDRRRLEMVIVELLHHQQMAYVWNDDAPDIESSLLVTQLETTVKFGWEWHGTPEPLVFTALTDRFNLTTMFSIGHSLGVAPFGPAGTGKTESVKALGARLGRRVIVFNCDETFDHTSVSRLLHGADLTGSWACFDEFNRLSSGVLSAVATEISSTQANVFVTMNPGYKGRQRLPTNLRQYFREFAMAAPESQEISEVLLRANGFADAPLLANLAVEVMTSLKKNVPAEPHYDWSLRTLKSVLRLCGALKLQHEQNDDAGLGENSERTLLRTAFERAVRPRLKQEHVPLLDAMLENVSVTVLDRVSLRAKEIDPILSRLDLVGTPELYTKTTQLRDLMPLQPGVMLVGEPSTGKSTALNVVAAEVGASVTNVNATILPKATFFGHLDETTREWTDGMLPKMLRGQTAKHPQFLVLDGPIEPTWAESLNSLLDDNRFLSLPTGERLPLPSNMHIFFEVGEIGAATPATVSRCGLVWFGCSVAPSIAKIENIPDELILAAESIYHSMEWSLARALSFYRGLRWQNEDERRIALSWAFSGDSDASGKLAVSRALGSEDDLTQFYVSDLSGEVLKWADSLPEPHSDETGLVPTIDTISHEALILRLISSKTPVLLSGPPGSGKTMTLLAVLKRLSVDIISLTLSQAATPDTIIRALEANCEYYETLLAPPKGRKAILFIDEVNLPTSNTFGSRPVLDLLRSLIERNGFWAWRGPRAGQWIRVERIQLVASGNPPPIRKPLPGRLLRHFANILVGYPSEAALRTIYNAMISEILPGTVSLMASPVVDAMLFVYHSCMRSHPEGVYSPRELTRWVTGLSALPQDTDAKLLVRLWAHEGLRLFGDRLQDSNGVSRVLSEAAPIYFEIPCDDIDSLRWSYLLSRRPKFVSSRELRAFLFVRLATYAEEKGNTRGSLVLYEAFLDHILRVDRVFKQPQGHMILAGDVGVGRKTLVKFVCWLNGYAYVKLTTWSGYGEEDFDADLRRVLLMAVQSPTCFVLDQAAGLKSAFIERMNTLLANDSVPGLFEEESLRDLKAIHASKSTHGSDGGEPLWEWFSRLIRKNLHVVFTLNSLKEGAIASPALLNRCVQDYMRPATTESKLEVAKSRLQLLDAHEDVPQLLAEMPIESPLLFLQACEVFNVIYVTRKKMLEDHQFHLTNGADRIREAVIEVGRLKKTLLVKGHELELKDAESQKVLSQMLNDQSEAERKREAGITIQVALAEQRTKAEARRALVKEELADAEPLLEAASRGVREITKTHLVELRSLSNPPEAIKLTLEAVCIILDLLPRSTEPGKQDWRLVQHAVRSDGFITKILSLQALEPTTVMKLKPYLDNPSFTVEKAQRASRACGPLLQWVLAQITWMEARESVKPLLREIDKLDEAMLQRGAQLSAIDEMLGELVDSIDLYKKEYGRVIGECEAIKSSMAHVRAQLSRSTTLLSSLESEQSRWTEAATQFDDRRALLSGNAALAALYVALAGPLDPLAREALVQSVRQRLDDKSISHDCLDVPSFLGGASDRILLDYLTIPALVIDPSGRWADSNVVHTQGNLRAFERASMLEGTLSLAKKLETALRFGQHLLLEHAEISNPLIVPILEGETRIMLPHTIVDMSPGFKLTLYTREPIRADSPLNQRVGIVSYEVGEGVLQQLVLDELVETRTPDLAVRRRNLLETQTSTSQRLLTLEEELLETLQADSGEHILENERVLSSLESLKAETSSLRQIAEDTETTLRELEGTISGFRPIATVAASIYRVLRSLNVVSHFYLFSLDFLWSALKCVEQAETDMEAELVREIWRRAAPALRHEDRHILLSALEPLIPAAGVPSHVMRNADEAIEESTPGQPIVVGLVADAEYLCDSSQMDVVALGSTEATAHADRLLIRAIANGSKLVIQNADLDPEWLAALPDRLVHLTQRADDKFRLILTVSFPASLDEQVYATPLLTIGTPVTVERAPGIRSSVLELLPRAMPPSSLSGRLVWLHAVVTEHKWSKHYEFLKNDFDASFQLSQISAAATPLELAKLIVRVVYGAKMDNQGDIKDLTGLVRAVLMADVDLAQGVPIPPDSDEAKLYSWANQLPDKI